jgi:hypothetical protein
VIPGIRVTPSFLQRQPTDPRLRRDRRRTAWALLAVAVATVAGCGLVMWAVNL